MTEKEIMECGWNEVGAGSIARALRIKLPDHPFLLNNHTLVYGKEKFRECLIADIKQGPKGARNKYFCLQGDIKDLIRASLSPPSKQDLKRFGRWKSKKES